MKRQTQSRWREYLFEEERDEVDELLDRAAKLDSERRDVTAQLNRIRNRCAQRHLFRAARGAENG